VSSFIVSVVRYVLRSLGRYVFRYFASYVFSVSVISSVGSFFSVCLYFVVSFVRYVFICLLCCLLVFALVRSFCL